MKIESPAFQNQQTIPAKYTCDGKGINPPLKFSDVPSDAKSLALIVDDPDAPGGTFTHWTVWNISPNVLKVAEGSAPFGGIEGLNSKVFYSDSADGVGYIGPCPPSGTHRYFFKLYALDKTLNLQADADIEKLKKAVAGHILASAELIGLYSRIR